MIETVGQFLEALVAEERRKLAEYAYVRHPTIIGNMYEGLTQRVLETSLPKGLDLRVVGGVIRNANNKISRQIDCMVVVGDGEKIPHTDDWIYDLESVVAILEAKKTLHRRDLDSGLDFFSSFWHDFAVPVPTPMNVLRSAWRAIRGENLVSLDDLSPAERHLCDSLRAEACLPVRVLLGFEGYSSELRLRQALADTLEDRIKAAPEAGVPLGPVSLPNLIVSAESSLVKLNGMPYPGPYWAETGRWGFYASRGIRPTHALLEVLWTRLNFCHGVSASIFGDDLDLESVNVLLVGNSSTVGERTGWAIDTIEADKESLQTGGELGDWTPAVLSVTGFMIVNDLCRGVTVRADEPQLVEVAASHGGATVDDIARELQDARIAYVHQGEFQLLTDRCSCGIDPELGFVAGEDKTGRMTRWMIKRIEESKRRRNDAADPADTPA